jgi:hypothetical protein
MKWSRFAYCAAFIAITTLLVIYGVSPLLTVPLVVFAAWWTFLCTRALWSVVSFQSRSGVYIRPRNSQR